MKISKNSILTAGIIVAILTILSKLLGFLREILIASYYGATAETDAFYFAQSMPAMIFPAVCSSVSTAFVSKYVARLTESTPRVSDRYASRMLLASLLLATGLSITGVAFAPGLVSLLAPGFSDAQQLLAAHLTRITMACFTLTMLNYMLSAILNAQKRFIGSQLAGFFYNVVIIVITVLAGSGQSMEFLTITVIAGTAIQAVTMIFCCLGHFHGTIAVNPFHAESRQLLQFAFPILLGNSVIQINTIVDKYLCSGMPEGHLSSLNYGNTLMQIVSGVVVLSLSTVLYPMLTSHAAKGETGNFQSVLMKSMGMLSFLLLPVSIIAVLCADDVVQIVYGRGVFNGEAIQNTALALACYAPMLPAYGVREVLTKGFLAMQDSKTPMKNSTIGVLCNIVCSILFVRWLGIGGIALGTTVSAYISSILLVRSIRKKLPDLSFASFYRRLLIQGIGSAIMLGVLLVLFAGRLENTPLLHFLCTAVCGFCVYGGIVYLAEKKMR